MKYCIDEKDLNSIVSEVLYEGKDPLIEIYAKKYSNIINMPKDIIGDKKYTEKFEDINAEEFEKEMLYRLDCIWGDMMEERLKQVLGEYDCSIMEVSK